MPFRAGHRKDASGKAGYWVLDLGSVLVTVGFDEIGTATDTFFFLRGRWREEEEDIVSKRRILDYLPMHKHAILGAH